MLSLPPGVHTDFPPAEELTPLFRQYCELKAQQPEALLLYRLGDFYEMFGPDAVRASSILGLTLTARQAKKDYKVAMAGVPHHSSVRYIKRLVEAGEVVAICEQLEDPASAKGLVERGITRVITAGTLVEEEYLAADSNNFLAVLAPSGGKAGSSAQRWGIAILESSGGRVELSEWNFDQARQAESISINQPDGFVIGQVLETVLGCFPRELLVPAQLAAQRQFVEQLAGLEGFAKPVVTTYHRLPTIQEAEQQVLRQFELAAIDPLGISPGSPALLALCALLNYLRDSFRAGNIKLDVHFKSNQQTLWLDSGTVKHLDLLPSDIAPGSSAGGGLYSLLNRCVTSAGKRLLKRWLLAPTADHAELVRRQSAVEQMFHDSRYIETLRQTLAQVADIERIVHRVGLRRSNPKELHALALSLPALDQLAELCNNRFAPRLRELGTALGGHAELATELDRTLADDPPLLPGEGRCIRPGADAALDELRELFSGGSEWFRQYEEALRAQTGIRTLKVKQTGPAGWFIEVSKANAALVPANWERRGTLVNAERYATHELRERESAASSAQSRLAARERELLEQLYSLVESDARRLANAARAAAQLDLLAGLASLAREQNWCRTELLPPGKPNSGSGVAETAIELQQARHPLVEASVGQQYYCANDAWLDQQQQQVLLITGPNMGGKSSYLRMLAVLCIVNQMIGFVPAQRAKLPLLDRVFTRIGAHDALARGQSTFMVEMLETARILRHCGPRSLIILDEVGRGTSTYDGISIAKAVLEYLHEHPARPLTLFATHFFELTELASLLPRLANFQVEVAAGNEAQLVFTYRVIPGAASESYGIEVARQAGLPASVVMRAGQILAELEEARALALAKARAAVQMGLFGS